jgi:hypothetical protein
LTQISSKIEIRASVLFLLFTGLVIHPAGALLAQAKVADTNVPANGTGVMVAGELWDSYMPLNRGPYYSEGSSDILRQIRVGNFDRTWGTPTHMWPGGWDFGAFWNKAMEVAVWDPDTTFNPATIGGVSNPSYNAGAGSRYAFAGYPNRSRGKSIPGAGDPTRDYAVETRWYDAQKRHHAIYEAAYPTTVGIDVKMKLHQYTLNWNNFNDFIIVELTLTNTGVVDMNADGIAEMTGHVIEGICANMHGEYFCYYRLGENGSRTSAIGAQRAVGFVNSADASGSPWAMHVAFPGESVAFLRDMGFVGSYWYAADVWSAWAWLGARDSAGADFPTRFGTHAVGIGTERGWYVSGNVSRGYDIIGNPRENFIGSMGQFFVDGGKSLDSHHFDLSANANLFEAGSTAGDLRTFRLKPAGTRTAPDGDLKATNVLAVYPYESGWTKGYTTANDFNGDGFTGIGPFKLDVGQSITITLATAGGFRLQGVANAISTARWVYGNKVGDYDLPFDYPPVPDVLIDNTYHQSVRVRWDNRADTHPDFAGYKVYKAALTQEVKWLESGTRGLDEYWRNMTPGPTPDSLMKPFNPNFAAQGIAAANNGLANGWGPYTLMAVIPKSELASFADNSKSGYSYSWEDRAVEVGFNYWYYVAAFTNKPLSLGSTYVSFSNSPNTDFVETSNVNRNGASGMWVDTYPFATLNKNYPKTAAGLKDIGAAFTVKSALSNSADLLSGKAKITVKPNPYKSKALFDSETLPYEHRIAFLNLPPNARITILDVSGQVIDQFRYDAADGVTGSMYWDMFSKDGIEVASGLYIYVVEYDGGQQVGYFSILF